MFAGCKELRMRDGSVGNGSVIASDALRIPYATAPVCLPSALA